jgi:hypothetical protein
MKKPEVENLVAVSLQTAKTIEEGLRFSWFYGYAAWCCLFLLLAQFCNENLSKYSHSLHNILNATGYDVLVL